ncbi:uncharacterized protein PGTG_21253 [Puccinia graminis f. sp. tritici CRL 75-36-700-3]|uniref:Uncharacterized protein n=1 Tax=Puccinia graminis f. sp. tritici (strain CRL 75-36-700-3 / race SCCL) TaxID=418459 RepID=H6QQV1_PUCGT|nr:uncharacterized protein PGTG_21253 [Puccinia graminis f. sp. tritici CRL 75-36-700-3]EHS62880.1 hypothetical protein PGTG_21253 [Puccinia graminis f. sp. tritici CRL 75-36-700-3]
MGRLIAWRQTKEDGKLSNRTIFCSISVIVDLLSKTVLAVFLKAAKTSSVTKPASTRRREVQAGLMPDRHKSA